jgi:hypothetical protein
MIIKQLDSTDVARARDDRVAFVESVDVYRGRGLHEWTEHRYCAVLYQRPVTANSSALASCGHEHHDIDRAIQCARRLLNSGL